MYTIIGGDGKEYGPVTSDQVRQWLAGGRANLDTQAKAAGSDEWKRIGDFDEFMNPPSGFGAAPASLGTPPPGPSAAAAAGQFDVLDCFARSWELLKAHFMPLVGMTLLVVVLRFALALIANRLVMAGGLQPEKFQPGDFNFRYFFSVSFGWALLEGILISQPLMAGYLYYILKKARGETATVADLFSGFTRAYLSLVAATVVMGILDALGFVFLILPGIYLAVAYSLTTITIVDRKVGFWAAMELSRRAVTRHWWSMLLYFVLAVLLTLAGACALVVGLLVALPLICGALVYAYQDLVPTAAIPEEQRID